MLDGKGVPFTTNAGQLTLAATEVVTDQSGTHPNALGHQIIADGIERLLRADCKRLSKGVDPAPTFPQQEGVHMLGVRWACGGRAVGVW